MSFRVDCAETFIRRLKVLTPIEVKQSKQNIRKIIKQNQHAIRLWETAELSQEAQEARAIYLSADAVRRSPCDLPIRTVGNMIATQKQTLG